MFLFLFLNYFPLIFIYQTYILAITLKHLNSSHIKKNVSLHLNYFSKAGVSFLNSCHLFIEQVIS